MFVVITKILPIVKVHAETHEMRIWLRTTQSIMAGELRMIIKSRAEQSIDVFDQMDITCDKRCSFKML